MTQPAFLGLVLYAHSGFQYRLINAIVSRSIQRSLSEACHKDRRPKGSRSLLTFIKVLR